MARRHPIYCLAILLVFVSRVERHATAEDVRPPEHVEVRPLFFVPRGEQEPTEQEAEILMRHLMWTQERYRELLGGRTFHMAQKPVVIHGTKSLAEDRELRKDLFAGTCASELLEQFRVNRFNCPYVFLAIVKNAHDNWPPGGGRPLNGGINTGGGIIVFSSHAVRHMPNFQSTLQHELGHAFGLPHVDVYGDDMRNSPSIMGYNPQHQTHGFEPGRISGIFIPEDLRGLALNDRALPDLEFDAARLQRAGNPLPAVLVTLGPLEIPRQPDYAIKVTTDSGEAFGSQAANVVLKQILPDEGPGNTFNSKLMWQSNLLESGWATLELEFPLPVELTSIVIHSEHSGRSHAVHRARVQAAAGAGWIDVADANLSAPAACVAFDSTTSANWKLHLKAGSSRQVVIRGLQFFAGEDEVFPPRVPCPAGALLVRRSVNAGR